MPEVVYQEGPPRLYTVDGVVVPSVTQVLGCLDKPALPWWGMTIGVEGVCTLAQNGVDLDWADPKSIVSELTAHKITVNHQRDKAASRGKDVHDALEAYMTDGVVPSLAAFPESERGYVQALAKWLWEIKPEFVRAEVIVGSARYGYAGRYDLLCRIGDDELVRCDLKTGRKIYEPAHLQLAAYEEAAIECGEDPSDAQYILRVGADANYEFVRSRATFEDFRAVLECYQALRRVKAKKVVA